MFPILTTFNYYLKEKKYPKKIKDKVNELNTCLKSYINSEENDGRDMIGSNYYLLEKIYKNHFKHFNLICLIHYIH